jgi:hypothetical protein
VAVAVDASIVGHLGFSSAGRPASVSIPRDPRFDHYQSTHCLIISSYHPSTPLTNIYIDLFTSDIFFLDTCTEEKERRGKRESLMIASWPSYQ